MIAAGLDARDSMVGWMRQVNKRLEFLERIGRPDLLSNTIDGQSSLTVRQFADIPEDVPDNATVYVVEEQKDYRMNPATRQWQATDS